MELIITPIDVKTILQLLSLYYYLILIFLELLKRKACLLRIVFHFRVLKQY